MESTRWGACRDLKRSGLCPPLPYCSHHGTESTSWGVAHSERERIIHLERLGRMGFFSLPGIFGHLTFFAFVFIVGAYVVKGLLGALCLLEFVILGSLYTRGDC